ncbi:hypothetical protein ACFFX0_31690 [Citricoccus parietis]|uniref:Uncharacterized protein n=1 Tax=Citricoccus parietis TaxID=592307 RepID=A0ABV5G970_9MICC
MLVGIDADHDVPGTGGLDLFHGVLSPSPVSVVSRCRRRVDRTVMGTL